MQILTLLLANKGICLSNKHFLGNFMPAGVSLDPITDLVC